MQAFRPLYGPYACDLHLPPELNIRYSTRFGESRGIRRGTRRILASYPATFWFHLALVVNAFVLYLKFFIDINHT